MREIKFRAWDAKQSVMVYDGTMWLPHERWEHRNKYRLSGVSVTSKGILWVRAPKDCGPIVTVETERETQRFYSDWDIQYIEKDVELMQWTGLQDKNGVDVYEKDRIRCDGGDEGVVEFFDGCFWYFGSVQRLMLSSVLGMAEVFGNVFECN